MNDLKNNFIDFLSAMEGYHSLCKMIHWSTTNKAEHLLVDEIDDEVLSFEDRIAEASMGNLGTRYGIGDLKTLMPDAKTLDSMLKELKKDILTLKEKMGDDEKYSGIRNILDEFTEKVDSWNYLRTLK